MITMRDDSLSKIANTNTLINLSVTRSYNRATRSGLWHNSINLEGQSSRIHNFLQPRFKQTQVSQIPQKLPKLEGKTYSPKLRSSNNNARIPSEQPSTIIKESSRYRSSIDKTTLKSRFLGQKSIRIRDLIESKKRTISMACVNFPTDFPIQQKQANVTFLLKGRSNALSKRYKTEADSIE